MAEERDLWPPRCLQSRLGRQRTWQNTLEDTVERERHADVVRVESLLCLPRREHDSAIEGRLEQPTRRALRSRRTATLLVAPGASCR